jgi:hypothetical protein
VLEEAVGQDKNLVPNGDDGAKASASRHRAGRRAGHEPQTQALCGLKVEGSAKQFDGGATMRAGPSKRSSRM